MDVDNEQHWCALCRRHVGVWDQNPRFGTRMSCPLCGSLPRHRLLAEILQRLDVIVSTAQAIVQVGPAPAVTRHLVGLVGHQRYIGLDLGLEGRQIDVQGDMTALPFREDSIDLMVVLHVLEHIPSDDAALSEIARVIGDRGIAVLQVPWRHDRPTDEDPGAPPAERAKRFGQADHVRMYGSDLEDRLRAAGLQSAMFSCQDLSPSTVGAGALQAQMWLVSGVPSDPPDWKGLIESVLDRRGTLPTVGVSVDPERRLADLQYEVQHRRKQLVAGHNTLRRNVGELDELRTELERARDQLREAQEGTSMPFSLPARLRRAKVIVAAKSRDLRLRLRTGS